jgi:hypothetical protein
LVVRFATHAVHAQRTAATHDVRDMSLHMLGARCRKRFNVCTLSCVHCSSSLFCQQAKAAAMASPYGEPDDNGNYTRWWVQNCPLAHECSTAAWNRTKKCASFVSFEDCLAKLSHHIKHSEKHSSGERTHQDVENQIAEASSLIDCELVDAS